MVTLSEAGHITSLISAKSSGMDPIDKIVFTEQTPDLKGGPRFLIQALTHICQDKIFCCTSKSCSYHFHCDFIRIDPKFVNNPELSDIQVGLTKLSEYTIEIIINPFISSSAWRDVSSMLTSSSSSPPHSSSGLHCSFFIWFEVNPGDEKSCTEMFNVHCPKRMT